jgi:hypothetical protein
VEFLPDSGPTDVATIMLEKQSSGNQVSLGLPYPNTTEVAGIMKVNDMPAILRAAQLSQLGRKLIVGLTT